MKAVADMFGGENHIPDSVKVAMKLEDYGKGKPLTARRITTYPFRGMDFCRWFWYNPLREKNFCR